MAPRVLACVGLCAVSVLLAGCGGGGGGEPSPAPSPSPPWPSQFSTCMKNHGAMVGEQNRTRKCDHDGNAVLLTSGGDVDLEFLTASNRPESTWTDYEEAQVTLTLNGVQFQNSDVKPRSFSGFKYFLVSPVGGATDGSETRCMTLMEMSPSTVAVSEPGATECHICAGEGQETYQEYTLSDTDSKQVPCTSSVDDTVDSMSAAAQDHQGEDSLRASEPASSASIAV